MSSKRKYVLAGAPGLGKHTSKDPFYSTITSSLCSSENFQKWPIEYYFLLFPRPHFSPWRQLAEFSRAQRPVDCQQSGKKRFAPVLMFFFFYLLQEFNNTWDQKCHGDKYKVDPNSMCSIIQYLSEVRLDISLPTSAIKLYQIFFIHSWGLSSSLLRHNEITL